MTQDEKIRNVAWRRRLLLLCVPGALIAAGLCWWWWQQPKAMRLVERTRLELPTRPVVNYPHVLPSGVLMLTRVTDTSPVIYTAFRWDGGRRWQVTVPVPYRPPHPGVKPLRMDIFSTRISLSPDARYLASPATDGQSLYVLTWRDGRLYGCTRIGRKKYPAFVFAMDTGQVLCWFAEKSTSQVCLVERDQLLATGTLACSSIIRNPYDMVQFSSDGRACLVSEPPRFIYYTVTVSGATLRFAPVYTAHEPTAIIPGMHHDPYLSASGDVVSPQGSLFDRHGRINGASDWFMAQVNANEWKGVSDVVVQVRSTRPSTIPQPYKDVRILIPRERASWPLPAQSWRHWCIPSLDGRFALTDDVPFLARDARLSGMLERSPLATHYRRYLERAGTHLTLYERPGRPRAFLHPAENTGGFGWRYVDGAHGTLFLTGEGFVSEDGRSVYLLASPEGDPYQFDILRFRW